MRRLRWAWCRVTGGHLQVTRFDARAMQRRCFLCDAPIGRGWHYDELPRPRARDTRVRRFRRRGVA